jgi:hypothetical protein
MYNKTLFWTTFYSALFSILTLKFFQMFNFIQWSPVGWADKWQLFATVHFTFKWVLFFIVLALLFAILYIAVSFTSSIPPSVTALLIGIIVVFAIEWTISSPETPSAAVKSVSIPFFAMIAIVFRFITGTAVYMKKLSDENTK